MLNELVSVCMDEQNVYEIVCIYICEDVYTYVLLCVQQRTIFFSYTSEDLAYKHSFINFHSPSKDTNYRLWALIF